jgi:hypothetical protein
MISSSMAAACPRADVCGRVHQKGRSSGRRAGHRARTSTMSNQLGSDLLGSYIPLVRMPLERAAAQRRLVPYSGDRKRIRWRRLVRPTRGGMTEAIPSDQRSSSVPRPVARRTDSSCLPKSFGSFGRAQNGLCFGISSAISFGSVLGDSLKACAKSHPSTPDSTS